VTEARLVTMGDSALRVELGDRIDPIVNARVIALAQAIQSAGLAGVVDVVPTYRSVAVYFDPLRTDYDALVARVTREASSAVPAASSGSAPIRVPVCYGDEYGPDLGAVAAFAGMAEADVVRLHAARTYRVYMLGFVPGFAYMGTVDARIAAPRLPIPRVRVPAGAVGIAGVQTGIYPAATPGGWQIVGRTPATPFDLDRADPCLFKPGDAVQFYAIDRAEFSRLLGSN
jgi:inhibitor of KinA